MCRAHRRTIPVVSSTHTSQNDQCQCGRLAMKPHCPFCGTSDIIGQVRKSQELKHYRCRRCAALFNDEQRKNCTAAPRYMRPSKVGPTRAVSLSTESLADVFRDADHLKYSR